MNKYSLLILAFAFIGSNATAQCEGRYYDRIFNVIETQNINFGRNAEFDGDTIDLDMHIFQPDSDALPRRPLIILAFGGSFTFGFKDSPDIRILCDEFAARGYVTATIDYRLGFENGNDSDTNQLKALFRGIQDMRAAVRFFYKDAATSNTWRIDTTQIFVGGVSAGAFIALNLAYFKDNISTNPPPQWAINAVLEVGGPEGVSGNPGYSSDVKGVINLCGALADTLWIQPGDPIIVSAHGTADDLVPYYTDTTGQSVEGMLLGSGFIHERTVNIGHTHSLRSFEGAGHVPFLFPDPPASLYMDSTVTAIRDFLFENTLCDTGFVVTSPNRGLDNAWVKIFPNPSHDLINVSINDMEIKHYTLEIFDPSGRIVGLYELHNNHLLIKSSDIGVGMFFLQISEPHSGKIVSREKLIFQ